MAIEELVLEKLRSLPPEKQQEVLDFAEFLESKTAAPRLGFDITEEDIAEARREMWGNFPRDDI